MVSVEDRQPGYEGFRLAWPLYTGAGGVLCRSDLPMAQAGIAIRGCASAGTALAYSRRIPPLDRLMLADYDAPIRTAETRR